MAELYINDALVDLSTAVPFALDFQISDIKNPEQRKGSASKTIELPGTQRNENLFSSVFILSRTAGGNASSQAFLNFDPTVKATARYYENGLLQFSGVCQFLHCTIKNGKKTFSISMFSEVVNFMAALSKIKLSSLNWGQYRHDLTRPNVQRSWAGIIELNGVLVSNANVGTWDGFGYYYGLIDYGFPRITENTFNIEELVPQVFIYQIVKMMFELIGVNLDSVFLESDFFKRHLLAWEGGQIPNIPTAQAANTSVSTSQENTVTGGSVFLNSFTLPSFVNQANQNTLIEDRQYYSITNNGGGVLLQTVFEYYNANVLTDPSLQAFNDYPFSVVIQEVGIYNISYIGNLHSKAAILQQKNNGDLEEIDSYVSGTLRFDVAIIIRINNVDVAEELVISEVYDIAGFPASLQKITAVNFAQDFTLDSNDLVQVVFKLRNKICEGEFDQPGGAQFDTSVDFREEIDVFVLAASEPLLNVTRTPANFLLNQPVNLQYFMPNMDCGTFWKGILNAFNLYVDEVKTEENTLIVEPLNSFYKGTDQAEDWTHKLDEKKEIKIIPTSAIAAKNYILKFKDSKDEFNDRYLQSTGDNYGQKTLASNVDFATEDIVIQLPFAIFPVANIVTTDLIVPRVFAVKNGQTEPIKAGPSIVQTGYGPGVLNGPSGSWHLTVGGSTLSLPNYPYVGHVDKPIGGTSDFSFTVPQFVFYTLASGGYPTNNLYLNHEKFLKELVDTFGKFLVAYFNLGSLNINQLNFPILKKISGVVFRLQKIGNYDKNLNATTLCELIRVIEGETLPSSLVNPPTEEGHPLEEERRTPPDEDKKV